MPVGRAPARSPASTTARCAAPRSTRSSPTRTGCAGTRCPSPTPAPTSSTGLCTVGGNGDAADAQRHGVHLYAANRSMTDRCFVDADGELLFVPERGALLLHTELGPLRVDAGRDRAWSRAASGSGSTCPTARARAATCARTTARAFTLPERGPIGANGLANERDFLAPSRRTRTAPAPVQVVQQVRRQPVGGRLRPLAARRRRPGTATTCRTSTTCASFNVHRHDQLRPPGPVDLHRAHLAVRHPGPGQRGLRDLPAALAGRRGHLPAAVVPPQRDERVHGPDPRARTTPRPRVRARAAARCTTCSPARPGRRDLRAGQHRRAGARRRSTTRWRSCSRPAGRSSPTAQAMERRRTASRTTTPCGRASSATSTGRETGRTSAARHRAHVWGCCDVLLVTARGKGPRS